MREKLISAICGRKKTCYVLKTIDELTANILCCFSRFDDAWKGGYLKQQEHLTIKLLKIHNESPKMSSLDIKPGSENVPRKKDIQDHPKRPHIASSGYLTLRQSFRRDIIYRTKQCNNRISEILHRTQTKVHNFQR